MHSILHFILVTCSFLTLLGAGFAGSRAASLLNGGSPARMHRKARKQIVWAIYASIPAFLFIVLTALPVHTEASMVWEERVLLQLPLTLIPLLSIWFLSVPRIWRLWHSTREVNHAPTSIVLRRQAAHPFIVVPFQMLAISACSLLYLLFVAPSPSAHFLGAVGPLVLWMAGTLTSWYVYDRRWQRMGKTTADPAVTNSRYA